MKKRTLGNEGLTVSALGLGCAGMSEFYGTGDEKESIATIHRTLELGVTLLDTADVYGPYLNEELVGRAIQGRRGQVVLATKFGIVRSASDPTARGVNGRPDYVRSACEGSLERLGVEVISIEENLGALAVELSAEDLAGIARIAPMGAAAGKRYTPEMMNLVNR